MFVCCRAFQDRCPHRLAPLSEGIIDAKTGELYCSYHGCKHRCCQSPCLRSQQQCQHNSAHSRHSLNIIAAAISRVLSGPQASTSMLPCYRSVGNQKPVLSPSWFLTLPQALQAAGQNPSASSRLALLRHPPR
jgi:hypothetical protein